MKEKYKEYNILGKTLLLILVVLGFILIYTGITYAYWQKTYAQKESNKLSTGCFSYYFAEETSSINLTNTYPMSEEMAMKSIPYTFTIENSCSTDMYYNITLNTTNNSDLDSSLNYKLIDEYNNEIGPSLLSSLPTYQEYNNYTYRDENNREYNILNSYILTTGSLFHATMNDDNSEVVRTGEKKVYRLYLWIDENVEDPNTMGKNFEGKVLITSSTSDFDN